MKTRVVKFATLIFLIVGIALTSGCTFSFSSDGFDRIVSVLGEGEATIAPDIAMASIGVQTRGTDAGTAVDQNNDIAQGITDGLKALGIEDKDIQTSNFSIISQDQFDESGRPTGQVTYIVDNTVTVTIRDLSTVGPALDASVRAGANSIYGVTFTVEDESPVLAEARDKAMADAQARAEQLAQGAGATLGKVISVTESVYGGPVFAAADYARGFGGGAAAIPAPVAPGSLKVQLQVNVVYELK